MLRPLHSRFEPREPRGWEYFLRAMRLRCPVCGGSRIFLPLKRTRSIDDWLRPLDGCPRCGVAYEREQGYFLLAIWGMNYGLVAGLGLMLALLVDWLWHPPMWVHIVFIFAPMPLLSLLVARHAKALWIALDRYVDPEDQDSGP